MVEYRFEERLVVQHQAEGSDVDVVVLMPLREGPRFVGVCDLEAAVGRYGGARLDGLEVDPEDLAFRVLVREVYCPHAGACCRAQDDKVSTHPPVSLVACALGA